MSINEIEMCRNTVTVYEHVDKKEIYICLTEDRKYKITDLEEKLEKTSKLSSREREKIIDSLIDFFSSVALSLRDIYRSIYGTHIPTDITMPNVTIEEIYPGEFIGEHVISNNPLVIVSVEPKIGWKNFTRMINDVKATINTITLETGLLEPFINNLYYPFLNTPLSYSILLIKLTEYILTSLPPRKISKTIILSENEIGKPIISQTVKNILQSKPIGVFERTRIETQLYPYMLLAKFHYMIAETLINTLNRLDQLEKQTRSKYYNNVLLTIASVFEEVIHIHLNYLNLPLITDAYSKLIHLNIADRDLIDETRRSSRVNIYLGSLADLYEKFLLNEPLIHMFLNKGFFTPIASSKLYELWVFTKLVEFLRSYTKSSKIEITNYDNFYVELELGDLTIKYNKSSKGYFTEHLKLDYLRPDFIIQRGNKIIVYDAKYKNKLYNRDLESLLTYIIEFSKPVKINNENILLGGFYILGKQSSSYPLKSDLVPVAIQVITLNPEMDDTKIFQNIEKSLEPLLK